MLSRIMKVCFASLGLVLQYDDSTYRPFLFSRTAMRLEPSKRQPAIGMWDQAIPSSCSIGPPTRIVAGSIVIEKNPTLPPHAVGDLRW